MKLHKVCGRADPSSKDKTVTVSGDTQWTACRVSAKCAPQKATGRWPTQVFLLLLFASPDVLVEVASGAVLEDNRKMRLREEQVAKPDYVRVTKADVRPELSLDVFVDAPSAGDVFDCHLLICAPAQFAVLPWRGYGPYCA